MSAIMCGPTSQAGQLENSRRELARLRKIEPDVTLDTFVTLAIYQDPNRVDHFLDVLRKAGMSE